ncbi:MAG: hypothetical protein ACOCVF_03370 [bacterium]
MDLQEMNVNQKTVTYFIENEKLYVIYIEIMNALNADLEELDNLPDSVESFRLNAQLFVNIEDLKKVLNPDRYDISLIDKLKNDVMQKEIRDLVTDELINEIKEDLYENVMGQIELDPANYKYEDVDDNVKWCFNILPEIKSFVGDVTYDYNLEYSIDYYFNKNKSEIIEYINDNYKDEIVQYVVSKIVDIMHNPDDPNFKNFIDDYDYWHLEYSNDISSILNDDRLYEVDEESDEYNEIIEELFEMKSNTEYVSHSDVDIEAGIITYKDNIKYLYVEDNYNKDWYHQTLFYFDDNNKIIENKFEEIRGKIYDLINRFAE